MAGGGGSVRGTVSLTLLLSESGENSTTASLRGNWTAANNAETVACTSKGTLESRLEGLTRQKLH
jgi:hypothetical protein